MVRVVLFFFFSSRRRHTRWNCDWSSDVCSSDLCSRVAWFRVATSSPASRRIFAYLAFARARAAGSTSSGGSTTQVRTYCNRELVRANCVCTRVKSDCTCFPILARVAAIRASSRSVASALSLSRSSRSQAATRNACSERKPRSLTARRTLFRSSAEGYRKLREITVLAMKNHLSCVVPKWYHKHLESALTKQPQSEEVSTATHHEVAPFLYVPIPAEPSQHAPLFLSPVVSNCFQLSLFVAFCGLLLLLVAF